MKILTALAVILLSCGHAAAQELASKTPLTLDLNLDTQATYRAIAERAGLNIVFVRNFRGQITPSAFQVANVAPAEALDQLAKQSTTFWTPWDTKTILVADDNQQNRRDYEREFVQLLPVGNKGQVDVLNDLRGRGFRVTFAGPRNTIFIRDTPEQLNLARSVIANPNDPAPKLDLNGIFVTDNRTDLKTPETARTPLKIKAAGPVSVNDTDSSRTMYETLARNAGINVLFSRNFRPAPGRLALKDVGFFDALDLVGAATGSFWQALNENTFMVFEDNQQNRRDYHAHMVETIYLPSGMTIEGLNTILNNLRTVLSLRGIFQNEPANAIVIHDTPARIVMTENAIRELLGPGASFQGKVATDIFTLWGENGGYFHTAASARARLQIKSSGPISFNNNGTSKEAFEKLAAVGGLQVLFGRGYRPQNVNFNIQNVDVIDAMDFLALQSGTFWQPLDARTVLVLEDNQQNRRDFETHLIKTIYLPKEISTNGLNSILNVLRTAMAMRGIFQSETAKAIVAHDTPQRIALLETIVEHLNTFATPIKAVEIPAPGYAENGISRIASVVRPELTLTAQAISINLNQDVRGIYETLANIAGLQVNFSSDFLPGTATPFRLEGVDALDALDYLSSTTGNVWKVVDRQSILVFPDNQQNRLNLEPKIVKTFTITNNPTPNTVNGIVNVLRTALAMRGVQSGDGTIIIQDTPQRMAVAEKIIASLDRAP